MPPRSSQFFLFFIWLVLVLLLRIWIVNTRPSVQIHYRSLNGGSVTFKHVVECFYADTCIRICILQIYLSLEGVQEEKMEKNIKPTSIEFKFHDIQGKNYHFAIPKLNKEIVPEECKVIIKPTRVTITMVKASKGNWLDLHYKEDKVIMCHYCNIYSLYPRNSR